MTLKRAFYQTVTVLLISTTDKKGGLLEKNKCFWCFSVTTTNMDNDLRKTQIENIDVQIARAVVHFCQNCLWRSRMIHISDSNICFRCHQTDKMSISKLSQRMFDSSIFVKNVGL